MLIRHTREEPKNCLISVGIPITAVSQEPSDEDEYSHNSDACVADHRAAVQEKDTVHVKRSEHGAKRDGEEAAFGNSETLSRFARRRREQPSSGDIALHAQLAEG